MRRFVSRREALRAVLGGTGLALTASVLGACASLRSGVARPGIAPLAPPDANGLCLPPGYRSRVVARAGDPPLPGNSFEWHGSPDGGACFATPDRGWIYVSNSELPAGLGGVGALRFAAGGSITAAYSICDGTSLNCAGGATPWSTWLTCEEHPQGLVWECDPFGRQAAQPRPALGTFQHEAIAVDAVERRLYLTEDTPTGRFYRFTPGGILPSGAFDLGSGRLEVAAVDATSGDVTWHPLPDPSATSGPTAAQVPASTPFAGGEGIAIDGGTVYFATKLDNRVWAYDTRRRHLRVFYDDDAFPDPLLQGVDNVVISPAGHVLVAEDGGDMQIVGITQAGAVYPLLQLDGHALSELTGLAFSPDGSRLYFSSQRGPLGLPTRGITYEVTGPFAAA